MWTLFILFLVFAYLVGSISTAIIACKVMGLPDPRTQGSGNPGATNVLRMSGKKLAILVLLGDFIKGVIPVLLARWFLPIDLLGWIALAAFLGHLFPVFFGFRGGKGVATGLGGVFVLSWPLGLALLGTWILVALIFRYSSLAAIIASAMMPVYGYWLLTPGNYWPILMMAALLIIRHHKNIVKLWKGEESKIGKKK